MSSKQLPKAQNRGGNNYQKRKIGLKQLPKAQGLRVVFNSPDGNGNDAMELEMTLESLYF